jgi:hypothetical protein
MRNVRTWVMMLGLVFLVVFSAAAKDLTGKFAFTPQGGLGIPIGDFADTDTTNANRGGATTGFSIGGTAEYYFTSKVAAGAKFIYNRFGFDEAAFADRLMDMTVDGHYTIMEFGAFVKYVLMPENTTRPFGRLGATFGKAKLSGEYTYMEMTMDGEADIAWSMGLEGAVGVIHMIKENIGLFGEVVYTHLMTDGKDMDVTEPGATEATTEEAEGSIDWIGVKGGATFFFGSK